MGLKLRKTPGWDVFASRGFSRKGKQMENNGEIKLEGAAHYSRDKCRSGL